MSEPQFRFYLRKKAMRAVRLAVEDGLLPKLDGSIQCTDCDRPATVYDHRDYRKELDVYPVCKRCNTRRGAGLPSWDGWNQSNNHKQNDGIAGEDQPGDWFPGVCVADISKIRDVIESQPDRISWSWLGYDVDVTIAMQTLYSIERKKRSAA